MSDEHADVVVIGAGPAGSTLACGLARAGRHVVLLEKDRFPRDKLCGEFLSGDADRWLDHVDARERIHSIHPASIDRATFTSAGGARAELQLPTPGIGVSRRRLDHALFEHAVAFGVDGRTGCEVDDVEVDEHGSTVVVRRSGDEAPKRIFGKYVIGAHGRRARIDRQLGRPFIERRHPYVGLKRHHTGATDLDGRVEIHTFRGGYCGMSHVEGGTVNVCMLLEESMVRDLGGAQWDAVVHAIRQKNPALDERLGSLTPVDEPCAVAQIPFADKAQAMSGVLFVGDAAGMIAPLAGDGQAMALESAVMLTELIVAERSNVAEVWTTEWRRRFSTRIRLGRALQRGLLGSWSANLLVRTVGTIPGLGRVLVALTRS